MNAPLSARLFQSLSALTIAVASLTATPFARAAGTPHDTPLQIAVTRLGDGRVRSVPEGLDCGGRCRAEFSARSRVQLVAEPEAGMQFAGWSGACAGLAPCVLSSGGLVSATFTPIPLASKIEDDPPVCDSYTGPALDTLKPFEGLTHEHSAYSDGDPHFIPADYFRIAKDRGYSFVASSEHSDTLDVGVYVALHASCDPTSGKFDPTQLEYCFLNPSPDKLFKWHSIGQQAAASSDRDFLAIRGFEWTSDVFGHINVYFSKNFTNAKTDGGYAVTMATFWSWFTRAPERVGLGGSPTAPIPLGGGADGLAHFNHPHDKCLLNDLPGPVLEGVCDWNDFNLIPEAEPRVFGIEAYNDSNRDDRYQAYLARALDHGWHLSFLGSEDEHFAHYATEERPKTVTLATALDEDAFKQAWLARRTYALTPGQHLRASLLVDRAHPMGSRLRCNAGGRVPLSVALTQKDGTPFTGEYQLYTNGGQLLAKVRGTEARFALPVAADGEHWYFVRVHGADGKSVAYLAPVWITAR